ncbi:Ded1-like DEAD-box RNA helicase [Culex quinquefasciatus]|uniref:Ded1-like DEAD-box RNA helicase n=1 Tax=Culex quinquefasciatus TaxID=7176 RepID=B0WX76_CULQU|nr:Ded1-like DEAD-box RNA helicase [Culex quinquefasciatus]|eukprot:XP_001861998.1 Ded1-like DEAD-box RNA helicase [Culex quinquefasciatus]
MAATRKDIEKAATLHRNRVTLTLRNVRSLEKVCADLISGAKKQKLRVKGPVRMPTKILRITTRLAVMLEKYDVFTPVQKNAIPIIMSECDVMACPGQFWKDCRVPGPDPL